ncbi:uncharacterized protein LOC115619960 [Scaptodrosophila lebanonensis]|uniref:tyrosinase n=1 Tax=Drosophila lebanonensis TaxID=7225 RepID=A0A6J2SW99_DROLE|nr:uncharacterized protein LOC115619960 [Scaptodrosophila lebanonensis]
MTTKQNLLLLFDHPNEPVFMDKGRKPAVFDVPDKFLIERYKPISNEVQQRAASTANIDRRIPVKDISIPDLRIPMSLGRNDIFTTFIPRHRKIASRLIDIFMGMRDVEDLQSVAAYARDRVNPLLFNYCLSVALMHRPDTKDLGVPNIAERFPEKFVDSQVFRQLREESFVVSPGSRMPIVIPRDYTASDLEPEHRLWYFREDMGVNIHHWHWHLVYPFEAADRSIVAKDRRGELFYYQHQQIIARYNLERLSNALPRVRRFNNLREPIAEAYFPKMDSLVASRAYSPRQKNTPLSDLRREQDQIIVDIADLERWRDRIYEAIHQGFVMSDRGERIMLDETNGIDVLGNVLEASQLSPNRNLYGDLHNMGHIFISLVHDPDERHLEGVSAMGDLSTTMRDPAFYRWHSYVDDIFQEHKSRLPAYTPQQLNYPGVSITGIQVASAGSQPNMLNTFWQQSDVNLSRGMDFVPRGNVFARFTHLQHEPFTYTINVNNDGGAQRFGYVRIFLGTKFDERGLPMQLRDQRLLMIELDKFVVSLNPGQNTIMRRSTQSSVTVPFERTFRNLDENRPAAGSAEELEFYFCICGWPQHMLIPKGKLEGMQFQLFVMVSNYEEDRVDQDLVGGCSTAASYCGVRDRRYPDRRSMGYPFDRIPRAGADTLVNFLTPNMSIVDVSIRHQDRTVVRPNESPHSPDMANRNNLLLLFEHPNEPVFMDKGKTPTVFDVPDNYLIDRYKPISAEVQNRAGANVEQRIPVREISIPDLRIPMSLGRDEQFSLFIPKHRRIAGRLIDIFMNMRTIDDLQSVAVYARDRVNPLLFNYALSVALLHRPDTKGLDLPSFSQSFPDRFVDSQVFRQMREESFVVSPGSRMPIVIPRDYTASDLDPEHRLWYFREDMGINLHHWHWHLVYPFEASDRSIVDKDRRGELFYYMHEQVIARYNLERFSNNLARVQRFNNLREPIAEGYFPKMDSLVASRAWPPRFDDTKLNDLNREADQINLDVADLERWRDRIFEAINQGFVVDERGNRINLDETRGIDILGNMIESSIVSPNRTLYGDFHNMGHVFISYSHDPDHRHLESFGVMGDSATAMRDPVFYRWHAYIDDIFQEHKTSLPAYNTQQLTYSGISITGIQVASDGSQPNALTTFWQQSDVNLSRGMDFVPRGNVFARFTHLQHLPFTYTINVNNDAGAQRFGYVRIFLGPKTDERGQPMLLRDQRLLMVELDKFVVTLNPGPNSIRRRSTESSVTIPFERTFRNLDANRPAAGSAEELEFNFCGCGWPNHMLIPKGLPEGMRCELFVMVSDYENDRVSGFSSSQVNQQLVGICSDAASYCGVRDRLYPDRQAMGFPFDRLPRAGADRLVNFLTPNMSIVDVTIRHDNRVVTRQNR